MARSSLIFHATRGKIWPKSPVSGSKRLVAGSGVEITTQASAFPCSATNSESNAPIESPHSTTFEA